MPLARFLGGLAIITTAALGYTMQQIALVRASYRLDQTELRMAAAREEQEHLRHQVLALQSPAQLEARLAALNVELAPTGREQVVRMITPWPVAETPPAPRRFAWQHLFGGTGQAEAQGE